MPLCSEGACRVSVVMLFCAVLSVFISSYGLWLLQLYPFICGNVLFRGIRSGTIVISPEKQDFILSLMGCDRK